MFTGDSFKAVRVEICHETGDETCPYLHSHVFVDFGKIFQTTSARRFDIEVEEEIIHPHIQIIKSARHVDDYLRYMGKEDPECASLTKKKTIAEMVWDAETKTDALKMARNFSDVTGILALYDCKPEEEAEMCPDLPLQWQRDLETRLTTTKGDDRSVIWVFDQEGKCGKSQVTMKMFTEKTAHMIANISKVQDAMLDLKNVLEAGTWDGKVLIVDLPRAFEERSQIYSVFEKAKDGAISSTKYMPKTLKFPNGKPHLVVFTNFMPDFRKMSSDRWEVYELTRVINEDGSRSEPIMTPRSKSECELIILADEWNAFCIKKKQEKRDWKWEEMHRQGSKPKKLGGKGLLPEPIRPTYPMPSTRPTW